MRAELEKLSARLHGEAAERRRLEHILHTLPNQILIAQDTERKRIAMELHDGVNQILGSIKFRLSHLESKIPEHTPALREAIALLDRALNEVRHISHNLRPSELDDFGLIPAVEGLINEFQHRTNIRTRYKHGPLPQRLSAALELALYRILQEALSNIEKHAAAHHVEIAILSDANFVTLNIRDDGCGFKMGGKGGLGIINMRERAQAQNGIFSLKSSPGAGTEISAHLKMEG